MSIRGENMIKQRETVWGDRREPGLRINRLGISSSMNKLGPLQHVGNFCEPPSLELGIEKNNKGY